MRGRFFRISYPNEKGVALGELQYPGCVAITKPWINEQLFGFLAELMKLEKQQPLLEATESLCSELEIHYPGPDDESEDCFEELRALAFATKCGLRYILQVEQPTSDLNFAVSQLKPQKPAPGSRATPGKSYLIGLQHLDPSSCGKEMLMTLNVLLSTVATDSTGDLREFV